MDILLNKLNSSYVMEHEKEKYGVLLCAKLCQPPARTQPAYWSKIENEDTYEKWNIVKTTLFLVFKFSGMTVNKYDNQLEEKW